MRTQALHIGGILQSDLEQVQQEWRVDGLSIEWIERCALARCSVVRIPKPFENGDEPHNDSTERQP